jgi:hypothetical protein
VRNGFCLLVVMLGAGCARYDGPRSIAGWEFRYIRPPMTFEPRVFNERAEQTTFDFAPPRPAPACGAPLGVAQGPAPDLLLQEILLRLGRLESEIRSLRERGQRCAPAPGKNP